VKWHSTDAWRGYYDVESDTYERVQTDCILSYSEDAENLKEFDERLKAFCDEQGIRYARVFTRTSNVFSTGYDFFVLKEDANAVKKVIILMAVSSLRAQYRDDEKFVLTALTGKDEWDENDKLLLKAMDMVEKGKDIKDVLDFVRENVKEEVSA